MNNVGTLYTYQHTRELHFSLDQTQYIDNALQLMTSNMQDIIDTCNSTLFQHSCEQLITDLRYNIIQINRDIVYIKTHKSIQKRMVFIPILAGVAIMSFISALSAEKNNIRKKREAVLDNVDFLQNQ